MAAGGYTVLARRYRPQQFADLVGQEPLVQALTNALKSNRVAHAYLFTGARGVGKTSTARILAKCLNCVRGPTVTPCDQCASCRAIALGEDVDVIEIDGASNNRVEEIRELRSNAQYRPTRSRYKIYIIDEVHMLTTSAFNALLKTLEEPPAHVKFIFATTEVHKVPLTILSRCQRFDFASIRTEDIVAQLQKILKHEGVSAEPEALRLIARRAAGSLRDAESLLDQTLAFGDGRLTLSQVEQLLGLAGEDYILTLAEAVLDRDAARAWKLLQEAFHRGVQPGELLDQLLEYWRDLLLLRTVGPSCEALTYADRHLDRLKPRAQQLSLEWILSALDLIVGTKGRLRGSNHPRVLVEMLLVRLTRLDSLTAISELVERLTSSESSVAKAAGHKSQGSAGEQPRSGGNQRPFVVDAPSGGEAPLAAPKSVRPGSGGSLAHEESAVASGALPLAPSRPTSVQSSREKVPTDSTEATTADFVDWHEAQLPRIRELLLNALGTSTLRFDLERASLAICAPNCLALRFPAQYNAERGRCERRRADLEAALRRILRRDIQLRFETDSSSASDRANASASSRGPNRLQLLEQVPLIREAIQKLGARWIPERIDPDFGQDELGNPTEANP
ncbi:MAG: DNA polymerase III subunit gamma/tau [Gemmatales bacterium]|nr:DNA polymerase III subunit gamma/tau [Gemmatales bacterium]MDW8223891.1 DNA polymerase III subunit gamma/tau [Gemmatales bacterium]